MDYEDILCSILPEWTVACTVRDFPMMEQFVGFLRIV